MRETGGETSVRDEGRRKLLKAAAVAGGAIAAVAALPGSWQKPLATVGGLPAHAQSSDPGLMLSNFEMLTGDRFEFIAFPIAVKIYNAYGSFGFTDPQCAVDDTWSLSVRVGPCGPIEFVETLTEHGAVITTEDGGCSGNIAFGFNICNASFPNQSISMQLSKGARYSNVLNASFSLPAGIG